MRGAGTGEGWLKRNGVEGGTGDEYVKVVLDSPTDRGSGVVTRRRGSAGTY
jgi:hypothetical protein